MWGGWIKTSDSRLADKNRVLREDYRCGEEKFIITFKETLKEKKIKIITETRAKKRLSFLISSLFEEKKKN